VNWFTIACTSLASTCRRGIIVDTTAPVRRESSSPERNGIVLFLASVAGTTFHKLGPIGTVVNPFKAKTESRIFASVSGSMYPGR